MNNKGQIMLVALMVGVVIIILALAFAGPTKQFVDGARGTDGLNCSSNLLDKYYQADCVATDLLTPAFIGFLIVLGGIIIIARLTT
jgi:hypothetical protein